MTIRVVKKVREFPGIFELGNMEKTPCLRVKAGSHDLAAGSELASTVLSHHRFSFRSELG